MFKFIWKRVVCIAFDAVSLRVSAVSNAAGARRGQAGATLLAVLALAGVGWYLLHTTAGVFSRTSRASRRAVQGASSPAELSQRLRQNAREKSVELERSVREMTERILAVAREAAIPPEVERTLRELDVAARRFDLKSLTELSRRTTSLLNQLNATYEVHIVSDANESGLFERELSESPEARPNAVVTGYYVVVEARDLSGRLLPQEIRGAGADRSERVARWAERVPKEIYDRIQSDRTAKDRLDETLFAVKQRGNREVELRLLGDDGQPLSRLDQLTAW